MQCCICSKWVHLKCSLLPFSKFRTLGSSRSWSCTPTSFGDNTVTSSLDSSSLYTSTVQIGTPLLMQHSRLILAFKSLIPLPPTSYLLQCTCTTASCSWLFLTHPFLLPLPPDFLRVLQWNGGGLQARSTELLHFFSSHPVDFICIQESNLNSTSSFQIPGLSALRSDRTHSRSGILSPVATHASGSVIIFVRQGLSFSEFFTSSLSSLDTYCKYCYNIWQHLML